MTRWLQEFLKLDAASGILLIAMATLAMVMENSPLSWLYDALLQTPVELRIGGLHLAKPLLLWINDGLMAVFFLLIALEVKREVLEGELSRPSQVVLPGFGAVGGMVVPALIYVGLNRGDATALNGWAIPTATDIAFALGILALLGNRVPDSLRLFLMTLAIFDDLGAIIIIAVFYTADLSYLNLALSGGTLVILIMMNVLHVTRIAAYVCVGVVLWIVVLKSGVHATLAGVALGLVIPLRPRRGSDFSPLRWVEHELHPWVAFAIVPIFAFANAGVSLAGLSLSSLIEPVPLGIVGGLFLGKQLGIGLFCGAVIWAGLAKLPEGANWWSFYGVCALCGIGFTMSLFITSLAFEHAGPDYVTADRLGILLGSGLAAVLGYLVLRFSSPSDACRRPRPS